VIGDGAALARGCEITGANLEIHPIATPEDASPARGRVDLLQVGELEPVALGRVDRRAGAAAYAYVTRAIELALERRIAAIVTAPINKEALALAGAPHHDHTSTLAAMTGSDDVVMMLADGDFRVALVTIHVSLREAITLVDAERVHRVIAVVHRELRRLGIAAPRIAVAGLNPHAGEGGLFGDEERLAIRPAIERARADGIDATGPWPGDAVFRRAHQGDFDAVVAQYHDQGLIPLKMVGFDHGVNVTLGLPFVRTSVDHGTAFDIAGTGTASHTSLLAAFELAAALTNGAT
jgi:4-hydroxythreonine-4-phosphate dehydrogenase